MYGIIYKVTNQANGKIYIGQTTKTLKARMTQHLSHAKKDTSRKGYFQRALKRHGHQNFMWEVIDQGDSPEELNDKEEDWIIYYGSYGKNGYNLTPGGNQNAIQGQSIYVFSIDGQFLSEHHSQAEAAQAYQLSSGIVTSVVNGRRFTHAGKVYLRADDFACLKDMFQEVKKRQEQERVQKYQKHVVVGIDSEGEAHFCPNIFEMGEKTGASIHAIINSCEGQQLKGKRWRFCWATDFKAREPDAYHRYNKRTAEEMLTLYYQYEPK